MDFFEAQDRARRNTWRLVALFVIAVVILIVLANLLVGIFVIGGQDYVNATTGDYQSLLSETPLDLWLWVTLGVCTVIGGAIAFKWLTLSGGGRSVAESLGGQLLNHNTAEFRARRLLNVVEEMAIASGIPVPPVYVIPEPSINAFAAGFSPDDAVIGVNQGTIDQLSREELQGVIGHEFSHILNNDISINLRLIAVLHGILFLGIAGYAILRIGGASRRDGLPFAVLGLGLLIIGYGGTFFGNLIKSGVSRQREYLADGAAVQFTRSPQGIAGALKKIGGLSFGSRIDSAAAAEASHLFFGAPRRIMLGGMMSTHPPLDRRILALEPNWNGQYPVVADLVPAPTEAEMAADAGAREALAVTAGAVAAAVAAGAGAVPGGAPTDEDLDEARQMIEEMPEVDRDAAHDPWSARALVYAILLDSDAGMRDQQMAILEAQADRGIPAETQRLHATLTGTDEMQRLLLVQMCVPTLKELSKPQYERFVGVVVALIKADRQICLLEWAMHRVLLKELTPHFEGPRRQRARYSSPEALPNECRELLSALAREASDSVDTAESAFAAGARELAIEASFKPEPDANFSRLNDALRELRALAPLAKPKLIKAAAACVTEDGQITAREEALMHGIAATLDCPLPPAFATQRQR